MSEENVDLIRRFVEAFNRGDVEGAIAVVDPPPQFEWVPSGILIPDFADVQRGPQGLRRLIDVFWAEFDDPCADIHELIDAGDQVFAETTFRGRGKQSGVEVTWKACGVFTVRDGRLVRWLGFTERDSALEAAGLSA